MSEIYVKITKNGPYLVYGKPELKQYTILANNNVSVEYSEGKYFEIKDNPTELCRCGYSKNPPFCDGSHFGSDFDGTLNAPLKSFDEGVEKFEGPDFVLLDNPKFCALARFCDANGSIWNLITKDDEFSRNEILKQVRLCPSGRLVLLNKKGELIEEELPKSIAVIEDSGLQISGPLWLRGGIRIENEAGQSYEIRNRQTICRCGKSKNKPFCDCEHWHIRFKTQ